MLFLAYCIPLSLTAFIAIPTVYTSALDPRAKTQLCYNDRMSIEYFEDVELHKKHKSRELYLTEKDIIDFAKQWDPQPFHVDPGLAKTAKFGGLIASGVHLINIGQKLINERRPQAAFIAGLALDDFKWMTPARPGDAVVLEMEAVSKRESKSINNAGIVRYVYKLLNQRGEELLTYKGTALTQKRPQS